ncbi:MAG TPA: hypothetical protein VEA99_08655 [Gemmatimonadaceae bacterium]|nr:hypothetical protein [Gemmatimonadaceae bacterium]
MHEHERSLQSLAAAPLDAPLRVREIVFDAVRAHCTSSGLHEGVLARRRPSRGDVVRLDVPARGEVILERELARFVAVEVVDERC